MGLPAPHTHVTLAEYRAMEATSEVRLEYVDGEVFAMAGGRRWHAHIGSGFVRHLGNALDGCGCYAYGSDMKVHVHEGAEFYPDALVVCRPVAFPEGDDQAVTNPVVVVEVLSPSTAVWDLTGKRERYATLASLQHYLVAHADAWQVHHYRRLTDGSWRVTMHGAGDTIDLDAVGVKLSVDAVYAGVEDVGGPGRDARLVGPGVAS
jgi:Uma2 family endonuclease